MAPLLNTICLRNMKQMLGRSMHRKQNHYEVLKLNQKSSIRDIKRAYYELSKKYHPDRNHGCSAKRFLEVCEAYKTLSNPETRHRYDLSLLPYNQRSFDESMFYYSGSQRRQHPAFYGWRRNQHARHMSYVVVFSFTLLFISLNLIAQVLTIRHMINVRKEEIRVQAALAKRKLAKAQPQPPADDNDVNADDDNTSAMHMIQRLHEKYVALK